MRGGGGAGSRGGAGVAEPEDRRDGVQRQHAGLKQGDSQALEELDGVVAREETPSPQESPPPRAGRPPSPPGLVQQWAGRDRPRREWDTGARVEGRLREQEEGVGGVEDEAADAAVDVDPSGPRVRSRDGRGTHRFPPGTEWLRPRPGCRRTRFSRSRAW